MAQYLRKNLQIGSMLVEAGIALALFSLVGLATITTLSVSEDAVQSADLLFQAQLMARNILEDFSFTALESIREFSTSTNSTGSTSRIFTTNYTKQYITQCLIHSSSTVTWLDRREKHLTFNNVYVDTKEMLANGGDCALDYSNNPIASGADLALFPAQTISADVDRIEKIAYTAASTTSNQLNVFQISSSSSPHYITSQSLPGVTGSYPGGRSIYYFNNTVYIATHRTAGNEFHIFDVTTPTNPKWLGSKEINHNINAVIIRDSYAYLGTSGNTKNIIILDISNPKNILILNSLSFLGSEDTLSIALIGDRLFIGRKKGTISSHPDFLICNIANPSNPILIGNIYLHENINTITVQGDIAYLETDSGIKKINIHDPAHMSII